ncbi:MAG: hypothetical protein DRQ78_01170 [Epsilonproteobacteria bacterium]|nr:MAG: hypothetical protein DRQ78_01170 [Campylobacterota bacterium]
MSIFTEKQFIEIVERNILALKDRKLTISSAESFTGGKFASLLISRPGSSATYVGGDIVYSDKAKILLGVKKQTLDKHTSISAEVSKEMAFASMKKYKSDVSISFTGNAGPLPIEGTEVGKIFITIITPLVENTYELKLEGGRNENIDQSLSFAMKELFETLTNQRIKYEKEI